MTNTSIVLVTGNLNKLKEYQRLIPADSGISLHPEPLDLIEIQSADPYEIVEHKLREAFAKLNQPVIVDDVSAGLDKLGGLPGPFIKFFMQALGDDALYKLAGREDEPATITCITGFYDGQQLLFGAGIVHGDIVAPRGEHNFGYDPVFQPAGQAKTYAEMTPDEKNAISHRAIAIQDLIRQISKTTL